MLNCSKMTREQNEESETIPSIEVVITTKKELSCITTASRNIIFQAVDSLETISN